MPFLYLYVFQWPTAYKPSFLVGELKLPIANSNKILKYK